MATHSSILAWKSPWTEHPGRLQSMGLHDWACVVEGGGRWVGSNKVVELKKKKNSFLRNNPRVQAELYPGSFLIPSITCYLLLCPGIFVFLLIKPVSGKGNQSWIFIGRTDAEDEAPILRPPVSKNWLIRKDPDAGEDWRQEEKGTTEDEMVGWHHQLDGHEFEQASRVVIDREAWCVAVHGVAESDRWATGLN